MVSLLDVAAEVETVEIRGQTVDVYGVNATGLVYLLRKFPELRAMFGKAGGINAESLIDAGGDLVAAIIACATIPDSEASIDAGVAAARKLSLGEQVAILNAALRVTLPNGIAPLVEELEKLAALMGDGAVEVSAAASAPKSRKQ